MRLRLVLLVCSAVIHAACARGGTAAGPEPRAAYPSTRRVDVADEYHGTRVADPYRWLEDTGDPEVRAWVAAQNALADRHLADDPLRRRLVARMLELRSSLTEPEPPAGTAPAEAPPRALAIDLEPAPEGTHRVLTIRRAGGEPHVLVDPRRFGPTMDVTGFHLSPDERYVAYTLSNAGSEWTELRIRRVVDGQDLPEVMRDMLWVRPEWTHDGEGFFYVRNRRPAAGQRTMFHSPAVHHHRVGTPQAEDRPIHRTAEGTTHLALDARLTPDGRHLLVSEGEGAHEEAVGWLRNRRWLLDLGDPRQPDLSATPVPLTPDRTSAYELVGQRDSLVYFLTDRDAPRRRLVAARTRAPGADHWQDVIPQTDDVLQRVTEVHGRWVALYLRDVQHVVRVFDLQGRPGPTIELPALTTVVAVQPGAGGADLELVTMSYLRPVGVATYDLATGARRSVRQPTASFDPAAFEARQVWYRSKDGTRVPMFVLHRRGIAMDGSHPTVLAGYGASHQYMLPGYGEGLIAWVELGGIIALPSLRGGGEFGRTWYEAAILDRKQTTIDDFVAAAEWLIAEGFTSPARLGITGASNGGLLVAATMAQRPELFAAAIAEVPNVDGLRIDRGRHRAQFGDPHDPAQFPFMLAYAPLQRIRPGTCYPATLVTSALNDERAPAWEAFKLAATLQAAQSCPRPVLLRAFDAGGHLGDRGPNAWMEEQAEQLAFVARHLGMSAPGLPERTPEHRRSGR